MKSVSILLLFSTLFLGCITESSVTRDQLMPDDCEVYFYLTDGSYIRSYADRHRRVEGGYQVSGMIFTRGKFAERFEGMVLDSQIDRFGRYEFSVVGTVTGAALAVPPVCGLLLVVKWKGFK